MNLFKKGPELKLSKLKVPDFVADLYYDLHDRRLLPLVALLVVGIIALVLSVAAIVLLGVALRRGRRS